MLTHAQHKLTDLWVTIALQRMFWELQPRAHGSSEKNIKLVQEITEVLQYAFHKLDTEYKAGLIN